MNTETIKNQVNMLEKITEQGAKSARSFELACKYYLALNNAKKFYMSQIKKFGHLSSENKAKWTKRVEIISDVLADFENLCKDTDRSVYTAEVC